jgi:parallel beta-helix repeat protein
MGNCWLSYRFNKSILNAPSVPIITYPFSDSLAYLVDTLGLDTLGEVFHFFPLGFPNDSLSTTLSMPVDCGSLNYQLSIRHGCFCDTTAYQLFEEHPDTIPNCINNLSIVNFQRNQPLVVISSEIEVNNDTTGCELTWHIEVSNPSDRPNLTQGKLLINIPSGLVLNTIESTYTYFAHGDSIVSQNGNYLNDSIPPHYSFQFEDFPTPPTTVLVLAFPSIDTVIAGSLLAFDLRFKLDQSTCNLGDAIFQSNFLQRILEARFTGYSICDDSTLYVSENIQQTFINNASPSLQSQINTMRSSFACCMQTAASVSLQHTCSDSLPGAIIFSFSGIGEYQVALFDVNNPSNSIDSLFSVTLSDSLLQFDLPPGLYSATLTTSAGLIYVFNAMQIQHHAVQAHLSLTQNVLCGGSPIILTAIDSNSINNFGFNASNPFIATDTLTLPALSYEWLNTNLFVDSLNRYLATANPLSDTTYHVVIHHLSGCADTASVAINVLEMQPVSVSITNDSLCSNMLYPLTLSPSGGQLTINGIENNNSILDPSIYTSSPINIHYEIQGDSGCVSSDSIVVFTSESLCNCTICEISSNTFMVIPDSIESSSQLISLIGNEVITNYCFQLNHNFAIDGFVHFINCEFTISGGKEIKISGGAKFDFCTLKGCQQMWAGINNYGKISANYTTIKDAHYGILMQRNDISHTTLDNTKFENNFVAIKTSDELGEHPLTMKSCVFRGGQLMDIYPGQNPVPQQHSLAGIVALNKYNLNVAPGTIFTDLCNGVIINKKASAQFFLVQFFDINTFGTSYSGSNYWLDPLTSMLGLSSVNGNGIFANSNSYVFFEGFGGAANSFTCFTNCDKGISVNQSDLEVRNTRFEGMGVGINAINERSKMVKILKNRIASKQNGIRLIQCDLMLPDTIGFNTLTSLPWNSQISQVTLNTGIRVSNQYGAFGLKLIGNKITAPFGMNLNTVTGIIVQSDTVNIASPNFLINLDLGSGIYLSNSKKAEISCNVIQGNTTSRQTGIQLVKSSNGIIENNYVNNSKYGFIIQDNCQTNNFKLNTIKNHQIGLNISATGILGNQINAGNLWAGNYSITGARRQSTNPIAAALSSFTIHNPYNIAFHPPFLPVLSFCQNDFFYCDLALNIPTTPFCNIVYPPSGIGITDPNEEEQRYLAYLLAKDSLNFNEFDEPVKYSLRKDIAYQLSKGQLSLPDTGAFVQFLSLLSQNPETDFVRIDKIQEQIKLSDSNQAVRQSYVNELLLSLKALHYIDSLMAADSLFEDASLIIQKNEIKNTINTLSEQIDLINLIDQQKQQLNRDSSFIFNQGVVTQRDFQEYEKRINEIYLNTVAIDSIIFSSSQVAEIEEIARLCPSLGGEAVFKARSLYELISDTAFYNDEITCLQQGVIFRLSQENKSSKINATNYFKVIPNPNNGNFKLKSEISETQLIQIRIVSSLGQVVYNQKINLEAEQYFDCLLDKSQGLYFIQIFDNSGQIIFTDKLIKN